MAGIGQLLEAGLSEAGVRRRVRAGRLHRVHRGVYAVGHPGLGDEGRWMAAVLAAGPGALLSHRSAAELWELLPATRGVVEVTVAGAGGRRRRAGLRVHRCAIPAEATAVRRGIPVTGPARTIADLRRALPPAIVRRAVREADFRGLDLGAADVGDRTRSELERAFLQLCRRHRLPQPQVNVRLGGFTVDFLWPERRLAVETDGWRAHRGRQAFEDDRERELAVCARGVRLRRFSARQVRERPGAVARAIAAELGTEPPSPGST